MGLELQSKELQTEIRECIDKHADALASDLAELFTKTAVDRVASVFGAAEPEAKPRRSRAKKLPRKTAPKKNAPTVARAKKRTRRAKAKPVVAQRLKKKSREEVGKDIEAFIRENPGCGASDVMKGLGIRQTVWMHSKLPLQKAKRIRREGEARNSRYFVTDGIIRRSAA